MNHRTSILCRRNLRAYFAAFITYVMLAGQVAPLALAAAHTSPPARSAAPASAPPSSARPSKAAPRPAPFFAGPNITATKVDAFPDPNNDGKAEPGDTITYTVTITNTGDANATGVTFSDMVDPNTSLVGSSSVLAAGDNYTTIGNVQINVPTAQGLLANDRDVDAGNNVGMTASGGTTSTAGGTVAISSDGSFTYNPPVGYNGTDTFTYTATTSTGKTATATARVVVAGKIWFVNNNGGACASNCNGRLSHPFTSLASFQAVNDGGAGHPGAGDNIFVYESATSYSGPVTFLANQRFIGQDATAGIIGITGLTQPSGTDPLPVMAPANGTIVNITTTVPATNALTVSAGGITLRGFTVGATTGAKIIGSAFGTLVVGNSASPDVTLNGGGQALNLNNGILSVAGGFAGVTTTSSATQGIILAGVSDSDGAGGNAFSFGSTSVSGALSQGILIGTTTADLNFGNTSASGASDGVSFQNNSAGTRTFGALTAGGTTGSAFLHGAGGGNVTVNNLAALSSVAASTIDIQNQGAGTTVNFAGGATLTKGAAGNTGVNLNTDNGNVTFGGTLTIGTAGSRFPTTAVTINGGSTGVFSLGTVSIFTNGFAGISSTNADGTLNVTGGTVDVNAASALNISGPAGFTTLGITLGTVNSTGGTNNVNLTNTNGTATLSGGALSGASGSAFVVSGGNPTVSFAGTLTQNNAGRVVDVQGTTGNSVSFTNTVTGGASSLGVHIGDTTAVNGNVSFTTLNLGTAAARMTNQAVTISNGGSGATYALGTISVFTNNVTGIGATNFDGTLNNTTGAVDSGQGTTVNVDGPAGLTTLGMTFTKLVSDGGSATGLFIQDTNGSFTVTGTGGSCTSAATCTGGSLSNKSGAGDGTDGVKTNNAVNISLTRMNISDSNGNGVFATSTNGIKIDNCFINSNADNTTRSDLTNEANVHLVNITGSAFGGANQTSITNSTITNAFEHDVEIDHATGTLPDFQINNSSITNNGASTQAATRVLIIVTGGSATLTVQDSTLTGNRTAGALTAHGIQGTTSAGTLNVKAFRNSILNNAAGIDLSTSTSGVLNFDITDNGGSGGVANNGASNGRVSGSQLIGISIFTNANSTGSANGFIRGNTVGTQGVAGSGSAEGRGIQIQNEGAINLNVLINNNIVQSVAGNQALNVQHGIAVAGVAGTTNATVTNNTLRDNDTDQGLPSTGSRPLNTDILNTGTLCTDIQGNTLSNNTGQGGGTSVLRVARTAGTHNNRQNTATGLAAVNTLGSTPAGAGTVTVQGTVNFNQPACAQPVTFGPSFGAARSRGEATQISGATQTTQPTSTATNGGVTSAPFVSPRLSTATVGAAPRTTTPTTTAAAPTSGSAPRELVPVIDGAGGTVTVNIGTMTPGDSVTITFQVKVDDPFLGAVSEVSNQGTVNYGPGSLSTLTDDPDAAGPNNQTVTPINVAKIKINNATQAEPASGTKDMVFTVTLTSPASGNVTVDFTTEDVPGQAVAGTCGSGGDYVATNGQVAFTSGQQVKTINVPICSDNIVESPETFLVKLSNPVGAPFFGATQATGTITPADTPGTIIISELRTRGPAGANDDFVELYNNTNAPINIAGYGVFKMGSGCTATPVLLATIPNDANATVPSRGHYLLTGSAYSLANYGGTGAAAGNALLSADIEDDVNVAVFSTAAIDTIASTNRLDAVGFGLNTGGVCDLMREGTTLAPVGALNIEYSYFRKECDLVPGIPCAANGFPKDTNDNSADFMFGDTAITPIPGITPRLGAPGPENRTSPIHRDDTSVSVVTLDTSVSTSFPPNRERPTTSGDSNTSPQGRLEIRRRVDNNTGSTVTRLRFRIMEMTTGPTPPMGTADLRAITSSQVILSPVNDPATCAKTGTPTTVPCQVTALATTLETPPTQTFGGGYNSTLSVAIPGGLAPGASINVNFALGIYQSGSFRFYIIVEALP